MLGISSIGHWDEVQFNGDASMIRIIDDIRQLLVNVPLHLLFVTIR